MHEIGCYLLLSWERKGKLKLHLEIWSFLSIVVIVLWCCSTTSVP